MQAIPVEGEIINTTGAIVFTIYIVAALLFTTLMCGNLLNTYIYSPKALYKQNSFQKRIQIFAGLATLSFSVLSYHMIDYLIESYQQWAHDRGIELPTELFGKKGVFSQGSESTALYIWPWLKTSTMFHNFARTICEPYEHYFWTQQALLVTMGWCFFMALEGPRRRIRNIWAYTIIAQILPISFTQNLFFLAMLMHPKPKQPAEIWTPSLLYRAIPLLVYLIFVAIAPYIASTGIFITVIFVIRLLLLSPLALETFIPEDFGDNSSPISAEALERGLFSYFMYGAGYLVLLQTCVTLFSSGFDVGGLFTAINSDPSVSTLGYDYLLSLISFSTWYYVVETK